VNGKSLRLFGIELIPLYAVGSPGPELPGTFFPLKNTPCQARRFLRQYSWLRLAQRVPVRIHIDRLPEGVELVAGLSASISVTP